MLLSLRSLCTVHDQNPNNGSHVFLSGQPMFLIKIFFCLPYSFKSNSDIRLQLNPLLWQVKYSRDLAETEEWLRGRKGTHTVTVSYWHRVRKNKNLVATMINTKKVGTGIRSHLLTCVSNNGSIRFAAFFWKHFLYFDVPSAYLTSFCLPSILFIFLQPSSQNKDVTRRKVTFVSK